MVASELNAQLIQLTAQAADAIDDNLEDCRLTVPHIFLIRSLLIQQDRRYKSGRMFLMTALTCVATSGAEPESDAKVNVSKTFLDDLKAFVQRQTLQKILFSPINSKELVTATELLAIYDLLLSHSSLVTIESPSFMLSRSFYLDAAIGASSRFNIEKSIQRLQRWSLTKSS